MIDYKISKLVQKSNSTTVIFRIYEGDTTAEIEDGEQVTRYRRSSVYESREFTIPRSVSETDIRKIIDNYINQKSSLIGKETAMWVAKSSAVDSTGLTQKAV